MNKDVHSGGTPLISVILLTANRKEFLERCLNSIFEQQFKGYEVIVVDNGSTDGTGEMLKKQFPHSRYYYSEDNRGVAWGRNKGVEMACSELCVFIDDDAYFVDDHALETIRAAFDSDERLGCMAFRILQPQDGKEEYKSIPRRDKKWVAGDYECSYFCGGGFCCRRSLFLEAGEFWEDLFYSVEELDLSYRIMDLDYTMVRCHAVAVIHDETPLARYPGRAIYFGTRNRFRVALRNLPWPYVLSHVFLWWGYYFSLALQNRQFRFYLRGVRDGLAGIPQVLKMRRPISGETLGRIRKLSGRTYY